MKLTMLLFALMFVFSRSTLAVENRDNRVISGADSECDQRTAKSLDENADDQDGILHKGSGKAIVKN